MTDEKLKEMYPKTFGRLFSYLENDPSREFSPSELVIELGFITREPVIRTILKNASWAEERQRWVFRFRKKPDQLPERAPEQLAIPFSADRKTDAEPPVRTVKSADSTQDLSFEDLSFEDPSFEDPSFEDQSSQGQSLQNPSSQDLSAQDPSAQKQRQPQKKKEEQMRIGFRSAEEMRVGTVVRVKSGTRSGSLTVDFGPTIGKHRVPVSGEADLEGKQVVFRMGEKIEALKTEDSGAFVVTSVPVENGLRVK